MVNLRLATMADSDRLLAWRNDPVTCANSVNPEPVAPEAHAAWMRRWVLNGFPQSLVLIGQYESHPLGVIRFEARARWTYEVSITIAPERRGRGWGNSILAAACPPMQGCELIAQIKTTNPASRHIFERNGFVQISLHDGIAKYRKDPC